jgi:hypothetical protein
MRVRCSAPRVRLECVHVSLHVDPAGLPQAAPNRGGSKHEGLEFADSLGSFEFACERFVRAPSACSVRTTGREAGAEATAPLAFDQPWSVDDSAAWYGGNPPPRRTRYRTIFPTRRSSPPRSSPLRSRPPIVIASCPTIRRRAEATAAERAPPTGDYVNAGERRQILRALADLTSSKEYDPMTFRRQQQGELSAWIWSPRMRASVARGLMPIPTC